MMAKTDQATPYVVAVAKGIFSCQIDCATLNFSDVELTM